MNFSRVGHVVLHHRVEGNLDGPVLVFANSLGTDFRIWEAVIPAFAASHKIVLYDKRGHGLSDAPSGDYSIDDHADDLFGLVDLLGIDRFSIVGLSVGGMIAQAAALRAPDRVERLALCCTASKIGTPESWSDRIGTVRASGIGTIGDAVMQRWFTAAFRNGRPDALAGWRNMLVRTPVDGYAGTCASVRDADFTASLHAIAAPTLCVAGDEDGATPPDIVRATAEAIPGARFALIAGAGHLPCIEQPDALVALLREHFSGAAHG